MAATHRKSRLEAVGLDMQPFLPASIPGGLLGRWPCGAYEGAHEDPVGLLGDRVRVAARLPRKCAPVGGPVDPSRLHLDIDEADGRWLYGLTVTST